MTTTLTTDRSSPSLSNDRGHRSVPKVVVIGGGISGLAAAYALHQEAPDYELVLLEATSKLGGVIQTLNTSNMIIEAGPESFVTFKPATVQLAKKLNIAHRLINTNPNNRRTFIGYKGKLHPLPDGFMMFAPTRFSPLVASSLFSWKGKLRMGLDLILPPQRSDNDESLAAFVKRRLGTEAFERVAEPLIGGIYGGEPEYLSAQMTVSKFVNYEKQHGSLIKGLWKERRSNANHKNQKSDNAGANYSMFASFDNGMGTLVNTLVAQLPQKSIHTNKGVDFLHQGSNGRRYDVVCKDGTIISADAVVIAAPAHIASRIIASIPNTPVGALNKVKYRSATIVNLVYKNTDISNKCNGFGFVVPRTESGVLRALSISSHKFANRVPEGMTLLRAFVGHTNQSYTELQNLLSHDLNLYLGIKADPAYSSFFNHELSMPQHGVGHRSLLQEITNHIEFTPGIALAGNAYNGIGISDCIDSGQNAAKTVLEYLKTQSFSI